MLHSCPTLDSKPLIPHLPILYLLPLPSHHRPSLLAILLLLLPSLPPDSLRVLQWNAGGLRTRSTELLHFLSSHPVDLICIQESNLNFSSSFRIPGFSALRSDRTHSRSGILTPDTMHASGGVVTFVRQGLSFSELSTSPLYLSSLDPYSDYVGINISLNNSSLLSFLNVYAPLFAPPQRMAESTPFLPPSFPPPKISSFLGTSTAITPSGTQKVLPTPAGRKYSTGLFFWPLPLNDPETSTLLHRSSGSRSSPDISFAPSSLSLSCCWEVLQNLDSDHLPILLSIPLSPVFRPNERPPSFNFQKARWDGFPSYFDSHCPSAEEYSSLSLSSAAALFTSLTLNAAKYSIPFGRIKRHPKAWWSPEVEEARLSLPLTEVMKIARLTSPLLDAPRQSSPRPRLRHGRRLALLSHLSLTLNLYTLFFALLLALPPRLPPLLTFLTALLPGNRLRSMPLTWDLTFPFLSQRLCAAEPEATFLSSAEPRALWSLTRPFALFSHSLNFFRLPPTSSRPPPLVQTKLPIPCWSTFLALAWIFFFTSSISSGLRISFVPSGRHLPLFPYTRWKNLLTLLLPSGLSLSPPACQSCLNASFYLVYSSFWNLIPFFLPARPVSALDGLHLIKFCTFLSPFRMS